MNPLAFDHHKYFYVEDMKVYFHNGKYLGDVVLDVDGVYNYYPDLTNAGGWSSMQLLGIGSLMFDMNLAYETEVGSYFASERSADGVGQETPLGED